MTEDGAQPGEGLFRWRSYTPLIVLAPVVGVTVAWPLPSGGWRWIGAWIGAGVVLAASGLTLRALAIGFAPAGTSGRATGVIRAAALTTDGVYSVVRHPMYLGNGLLWLGVAAFAGHASLIAFTAGAFYLLHRPIIEAEDRYLRARFGSAHATWAERTPALLPRSVNWVAPSRSFQANEILRRDYHAIFAFVAASWSVTVARSVGVEGILRPSWSSSMYFTAGAVFFAVMHVVRRRGG